MSNRKLIITWVPDVLHMEPHNGSTVNKEQVKIYPIMHDNFKGKTCRSERDSFSNIKTIEAAEKILKKRNRSQIQFASYNNKVIFPFPI